jgi:flagellar FliL protein
MEKKGNKKKFINLVFILIMVSFVIIITVNATSCTLFKKKGNSTKATTEKATEGTKVFGPTFDLGEMIVNLSDEGQARYAKMSVAFELKDEKALEEAKKRDPQIRDMVVELIGSETSEEILSLDTRNALKQEILKKINTQFAGDLLVQVFFTNILVQ